MQLTIDGREVPGSEVDAPDRETDPRHLRARAEVRKLHDVVKQRDEEDA